MDKWSDSTKIAKVCTSTYSESIFWITESGHVYGTGDNRQHQLGIGNDENQRTPVLIEELQDVTDIQCADEFTLALCTNSTSDALIIIQYWTKIAKIDFWI